MMFMTILGYICWDLEGNQVVKCLNASFLKFVFKLNFFFFSSLGMFQNDGLPLGMFLS
jgi:hypothetical protein